MALWIVGMLAQYLGYWLKLRHTVTTLGMVLGSTLLLVIVPPALAGDMPANSTSFQVADLRCEDLVNPIGIETPNPRFSWRMVSEAQGAAQSAYQLVCATKPSLLENGKADLWNTEKVTTNASRFIAYGGKDVRRGMPCYWMVRIWDENGKPSAWSEPGVWTYADLKLNANWSAKWITAKSSSPWLRQTVELEGIPNSAYIYVNVLGYFQLFINGMRVEADEFTPHVGQYDKRTFCITYDVAKYLKKGQNVVGFWLGSGWNRDGAGVQLDPSVRAQLEIVAADGKTITVATDQNWRAKSSSMAYRGEWKWRKYGGEVHTGSQDQPDWANCDFDDSAWPKAALAQIADTPVSSEMLQRSRVIETITAVKVTNLKLAAEADDNLVAKDAMISVQRRKALTGATTGTNWLVDMGTAMTGTFEITFPKAEKGHKVSMEFGDSYDANSSGGVGKVNSFGQSSEYICRGDGVETFKNRFNYASCRYILITNAPEGKLTPDDIKGHFITTDLPKASTFSCSNKTLDGIYSMMEHTLRCLMLGGYQVDCHSRERFGYGGDGHSSLDTTLCFLRADAFYRKWTRDWLDGQNSDGGLTYTSPASGHGGGPFWCGFLTAATLKHYHHYGDISLVRRNYPAIKKWFELAQSKTVNNLQMKFCGGWYLGDWASPSGTNDKENAEVFIHSYMSYALKQAAQLADALGETADARMFRQWAAARNAATHKKFYDPQGRKYGSGDQITYILPLIAGVVADDLNDEVLAGFEETMMVKNKGHLSTGLSGTYLMIQYLQSIGRDDLIYQFASKTTFPSWGYMIENGATATWEYWNGKASRIHNCYNNIGSWFVQGLAGIRPDINTPGFKNAIIKPAFVTELSYVNGSHDSVYGTIQSSWKRSDNSIILKVKIPPNSTATVYVPAKAATDVTVNGQSATKADHVTFLKIDNNRAILNVESGSYEFVSRHDG